MQSCGSDQHRAFFSSLCCLCSGAEARRASRVPRYDVCRTHQDDIRSWGSGILGSKQSSWPPEAIPGNKELFPPVTVQFLQRICFSWLKEVFKDLLNSNQNFKLSSKAARFLSFSDNDLLFSVPNGPLLPSFCIHHTKGSWGNNERPWI